MRRILAGTAASLPHYAVVRHVTEVVAVFFCEWDKRFGFCFH